MMAAKALRQEIEIEDSDAKLTARTTALLGHGRNDPDGVYLCLVSLYYSWDQNANLLELPPDCPVSDMNTVRKHLNRLSSIGEQSSLEHLLHVEMTSNRLLSWIYSRHGGIYSCESSSIKIPDITDGILQFAFLQHPSHVRERFEAAVKAKGSKSTVRFHGTCMASLASILENGLVPKHREIWTVKDPNVAGGYGYNYVWQLKEYGPSGNTHSLAYHPILLGLEVAGHRTEDVTIIYCPNEIIVRYIFLLPSYHMPESMLVLQRGVSILSEEMAVLMERNFRTWPTTKGEIDKALGYDT